MTPATSLPTLRVGALDEALTADALGALTGAQLADFLLQRRWFGGKGRAPTAVRIGDVVELPEPDARFAVIRLDVDLGGRTSFYQLPLAVRRDDGREPPAAALARVEAGSARGILFDAVEDDGFRRALGRAFAEGETFGTDGARLVFEAVGERDDRPDVAAFHSRTLRAEQSNTSIVFGESAILKLFRRLEPGVNPDVEIGHFLTTHARFPNTPPLYGVIRYEGADGVSAVAGMLQGFLPASADAWQDALGRSRAYFSSTGDDAHPYAADAAELGRVTRALHEALATPSGEEDFGPRPATATDVARWAASARHHVEEGVTLLAERLAAGAVRDEGPARALAERREATLAHLDELVAFVSGDAGQLVRHHGDYHLGQVLRTREGEFQIIDFEGEPARPLAERRQRNSPLRDVAGMLRSFAYAAATLAAEGKDSVDAALLERRSREWEQESRAAFLRGYLGDAPAAFLPRDEQRVDALLELFELEKVYYELMYELNNRPEWVWIPIAGALAHRAAAAGRS